MSARMKRETRIIREHRVFGTSVRVEAASVEEARREALRIARAEQVWDHNQVTPTTWEFFVSSYTDAFALND